MQKEKEQLVTENVVVKEVVTKSLRSMLGLA
jgi:hypothetical protein